MEIRNSKIIKSISLARPVISGTKLETSIQERKSSATIPSRYFIRVMLMLKIPLSPGGVLPWLSVRELPRIIVGLG
tara:strand:+ start:354 stop:581 length:228 start_codon:yes stop_codon:yes gene_type:complete